VILINGKAQAGEPRLSEGRDHGEHWRGEKRLGEGPGALEDAERGSAPVEIEFETVINRTPST